MFFWKLHRAKITHCEPSCRVFGNSWKTLHRAAQSRLHSRLYLRNRVPHRPVPLAYIECPLIHHPLNHKPSTQGDVWGGEGREEGSLLLIPLRTSCRFSFLSSSSYLSVHHSSSSHFHLSFLFSLSLFLAPSFWFLLYHHFNCSVSVPLFPLLVSPMFASRSYTRNRFLRSIHAPCVCFPGTVCMYSFPSVQCSGAFPLPPFSLAPEQPHTHCRRDQPTVRGRELHRRAQAAAAAATLITPGSGLLDLVYQKTLMNRDRGACAFLRVRVCV